MTSIIEQERQDAIKNYCEKQSMFKADELEQAYHNGRWDGFKAAMKVWLPAFVLGLAVGGFIAWWVL